jgi:hypothetical protein
MLATYSGWLTCVHSPPEDLDGGIALKFPANATSHMKGAYLMWMIEWAIWNRTYLSTHVDAPTSYTILPTTESEKDEKAPENRHIPWRDAVIRLAYYHILDNLIHVIYLRHYWPFDDGKPYTAYINNSEILTVVLAVQMVAWVG